MRSSLLISLAVHLLITFIAMNWVSFREVKFVPRQVYAVDIVTAAEIQKEVRQPEASRKEPEPVPPKEEPEPEPEPEEEMPPPPETPKPVKKKPVKKPRREIPTTQIEKTVEPEDATDEPAPAETGQMAFDTDDFPFAHYISRMRRKIAAQWRVPEGSQGENRFCVIYFRVLRNGAVESTAIEQSSGLFIFDQAAQRAVVQASPMPPLPQEYRDEYLGVHFSFSYKEER
jgi:TonB family protein